MLKDLVTESFLRPRLAARRVLALGLPEPVLVQAAVVVSCVGVVLGYLALRLSPDAADLVTAAILGSPLTGAAIQLAIMAVITILTLGIGRLFGGKGTLAGALVLVVWLNGITVLIQGAQVVALLLFPPLAAVIAFLTVIWMVWAYANSVAELHGFQNPAIVLGVVVLTAIVLFMVTAMMLMLLGLAPMQEIG